MIQLISYLVDHQLVDYQSVNHHSVDNQFTESSLKRLGDCQRALRSVNVLVLIISVENQCRIQCNCQVTISEKV